MRSKNTDSLMSTENLNELLDVVLIDWDYIAGVFFISIYTHEWVVD